METIHTYICARIPKFGCNGDTSLLTRDSFISTKLPQILSLQLLLFAGKKKKSETKYSEYSTKSLAWSLRQKPVTNLLVKIYPTF
jgi:hypothetical protein